MPPKSSYLSTVGRGAGPFALSTGYRSRTANLTSSASSVRNLRMFKMRYSWSVRTMLPCKKTPQGIISQSVLERSLAGNARGASHSPCRTARWWGDKQPRCSQTGSPRSCLYPAASRWPAFWFSNAYGTAKSREHLSDDAKSPACDVLRWNIFVGFLSYWSLLQHWPLLSEYKYWKDKNPNPNNTKVRQLLGKIISPWYL